MPSASGIRAGLAYVELGVDDSGLVKGLESGAARVKSFGAGITAVGASIAALGGAGVGLFTAGIAKWVEGGTRLEELSKRTGVAVEDLSTLGFAASHNGVEVEALGMAFRRMSQEVTKAADGSKVAVEALGKLGLTAGQLQHMKVDDVFRLIGSRIGEVQDPLRRAALAITFFGRTGTQLLPLFESSRALKEMEDRARALGLVTSGESAKAAKEFGNSLKDLWAVLGKVSSVMGASVAPELSFFIKEATTGAVRILNWVKANREMVVLAAEVSLGLLALGTVIAGLGAGIILLGIGLTSLATLLGVAGAALGLLVSPVGAALITVALLDAGMNDLGKDSAFAADFFTGQWKEALSLLEKSWAGIVAALKKGDLQAAASIALKGLNAVWTLQTSKLLDTWRFFSNEMQNVWLDLESAWDKFNTVTIHEAGAPEAVTFGNPKVQDAIAKRRQEANQKLNDGLAKDTDDLKKAKKELQDAIDKANATPPTPRLPRKGPAPEPEKPPAQFTPDARKYSPEGVPLTGNNLGAWDATANNKNCCRRRSARAAPRPAAPSATRPARARGSASPFSSWAGGRAPPRGRPGRPWTPRY